MARGRNDANAERGTIISQGISQKNTKREDKVKMKDRQGERERESDKDRRKERATASIASPWQPAPGWGRDKYGRGKRGRGALHQGFWGGGEADRPHYTGPISASLPKGAKQEVATIPATLRGLPREGAVRLRLSARQTSKWHPYGSHAAPSFDTMPEAWCGIRGLAEHWS